MQIAHLMMMLEAPLPAAGETADASGVPAAGPVVPGDVARAFQDLMAALLGEEVDARSLLAAGAEAALDRVAAENLPEDGLPAEILRARMGGQEPGLAESATRNTGEVLLGIPGAAPVSAIAVEQAGTASAAALETARAAATSDSTALPASPVAEPDPAVAALPRSAEQSVAPLSPRDAASSRDAAAPAPDALAGEQPASSAAASQAGSGANTGSGTAEREAAAAFQRFASQQVRTVDSDAAARPTAAIATDAAEPVADGQRSGLSDAIDGSGRAGAHSGSQSGTQSGAHSGTQSGVEGQQGVGIDPASSAQGATAARATPGVEPVPIAPGVPAPAALAPPTHAGVAAPHAAPPSEAVPLHVEWLAARGGGSARVQLHPRELGELQLTVVVRGQDVEVSIRAQEVTAGQAVLASRDQLLDGLAARDLRMDGFDVRWDEPAGSGRGGRDAASPDGREQREPEQAPDRPAPWQDDQRPIFVQSTPGSSATAANSAVDLHV